MNLSEIQEQLKQQSLDGWLFFDHHLRDPLAYRVLGLQPAQHVTRRWYYFVPQKGEPRKLVHRVESHMLDTLAGETYQYSGWEEQLKALPRLLAGSKRVAMQYSPQCAIPYVALVDAGTVELVRSTGVEVVSSAALIQHFEARLDQAALDSHLEAGRIVDGVRNEAFAFIKARLRAENEPTELEVAEFIRREFKAKNLRFESGPIVAVNRHAGDPHYEPNSSENARIGRDALILLDMWAKLDRPGSIYYDITWTGFSGEVVPNEIAQVFEIVKRARDAAMDRVEKAFETQTTIHGFEVDDASRAVIHQAGYGDKFIHRTGHSIGREVHGNGANMDNLETHDDRVIIPWSCFSIEPGIYLSHFGIRSEINMFVDGAKAFVTGEKQNALVRI